MSASEFYPQKENCPIKKKTNSALFNKKTTSSFFAGYCNNTPSHFSSGDNCNAHFLFLWIF